MIFAYFYTDKLINYLLSSTVNMASMLIILKEQKITYTVKRKTFLLPKCVSLYTIYIDFSLSFFCVLWFVFEFINSKVNFSFFYQSFITTTTAAKKTNITAKFSFFQYIKGIAKVRIMSFNGEITNAIALNLKNLKIISRKYVLD